MRNSSKIIASSAAAFVCLTLGNGLRAQGPADEYQPATESKFTLLTQPAGTAPTTFNKASGILGMNVRNQHDEQLGYIKDIVFDLKSERVAYAVLNTDCFTEEPEKLHAVPLSALSPSSDGKYLSLRTDRDKFAAAEGIDPDNWPGIGTSAWGAEPFWQKQADAPKAAFDTDRDLDQNKVTTDDTDDSNDAPDIDD